MVQVSNRPSRQNTLARLDALNGDAFSGLHFLLAPSGCLSNIFLKNNYKWRIGILETIFDGIQRPLKTIAEISKSVFVPRGVDLPCLD